MGKRPSSINVPYRAGGDEGLAGAARVVEPAEGGKDRVVERLNAEAHPVHAGDPVGGELLAADALRVGLDRDLDVGSEDEAVTDRLENRGQLLGLEQRWRPSAQEHRRDD